MLAYPAGAFASCMTWIARVPPQATQERVEVVAFRQKIRNRHLQVIGKCGADEQKSGQGGKQQRRCRAGDAEARDEHQHQGHAQRQAKALQQRDGSRVIERHEGLRKNKDQTGQRDLDQQDSQAAGGAGVVLAVEDLEQRRPKQADKQRGRGRDDETDATRTTDEISDPIWALPRRLRKQDGDDGILKDVGHARQAQHHDIQPHVGWGQNADHKHLINLERQRSQ